MDAVLARTDLEGGSREARQALFGGLMQNGTLIGQKTLAQLYWERESLNPQNGSLLNESDLNSGYFSSEIWTILRGSDQNLLWLATAIGLPLVPLLGDKSDEKKSGKKPLVRALEGLVALCQNIDSKWLEYVLERRPDLAVELPIRHVLERPKLLELVGDYSAEKIAQRHLPCDLLETVSSQVESGQLNSCHRLIEKCLTINSIQVNST